MGTEPGPTGAADRPTWTRVEVAWPLALLSGFAGGWVGLRSSFPGAPALLAVLSFAPLFGAFQRRREPGTAALLALGWAVGLTGALVGGALEGEAAAVLASAPFADVFRGELPLAAEPGGPSLVRHLGLAAAIASGALIGARGTVGIALLALVVAARAAAAGALAALGARAGSPPFFCALASFPPGWILETGAWILFCASLGVPAEEAGRAASTRRALLRGGLGLQAAALLALLTGRGAWSAWIVRTWGEGGG